MSSTYEAVKEELLLYYKAKRLSLKEFVIGAWEVLEPGNELEWNWHLDHLIKFLEAVDRGQIKRLLINVPPRTLKSFVISVCFPAWRWKRRPSLRFLINTADQDLATDLSHKCRTLVESDWYKEIAGEKFELLADQNTKTKFSNSLRGVIQAKSITAKIIGRGADCIIIDDPHDPKNLSESVMQAAREGYRALFTRRNDPRKAEIVLVCQRVAVNDLSAIFLETEPTVEHICLPAEYIVTNETNSLGVKDPRREEGELLFKTRLTREVLSQYKRTLGKDGYLAQFQQKPSSEKEGSIFRDANWKKVSKVSVAPRKLIIHRHWDFAATEGNKGSYTATAKLGFDVLTRNVYILHMQRKRLSPGAVETWVRETAETDGKEVSITTEEEKGSSGKYTSSLYARHILQGYAYRGQPLWASKVDRARPLAAAASFGNIYLVEGEWNQEFIDVCREFPSGYNDLVDAASGAYYELTSNRTGAKLATFKLTANYKQIVDGPNVSDLRVIGYVWLDLEEGIRNVVVRMWQGTGKYYVAEVAEITASIKEVMLLVVKMQQRQEFEVIGMDEDQYWIAKQEIEEVERDLPYIQILDRNKDRQIRQRKALTTPIMEGALLIREQVLQRVLSQMTSGEPSEIADTIAGAIELARSY